MASYSGLNARRRDDARHVILEGCGLLLRDPASVHYTQGAQRWSAIRDGLRVVRHQALSEGDCSSTATWLLWNALTHAAASLRFPDIVNGTHWTGGYTGTLAEHGKPVRRDGAITVGDLVLYGSGWPYEHVAVALSPTIVFSHGGEAGPFKLAIDYRPDRAMVRRYI